MGNSVGVLDFLSFLCPSVYLCVSQSVLSVHLFRINLKFLKTHNY